MKKYKKEFIEFLLETNALKFGDFTLKSGRKSPFFMNIGSFTSGKDLLRLAKYYSEAIIEEFGLDFDILFGPAYKGIPLAVATGMSMHWLFGKEVKYSSNRKEIKDHGDVGEFIGEKVEGKVKVLIIEDVTTSGKSIDETYPLLTKDKNVEIVGLIVSVDRGEFGKNKNLTALKSIEKDYGFKTSAIVTMSEVIDYLKENRKDLLTDEFLGKINSYYEEYGVANDTL